MKAFRRSFKDLWVWQRSVALVLDVYTTTDAIPRGDASGIVRQLRRAVTAIPVKIARGVGIGRCSAYVRCLLTAYGCTLEVETAVHVARELNLISADAADRLLLTNDEVGQMLVSMVSALQLSPEPGS
jgi:four helix bundle protein